MRGVLVLLGLIFLVLNADAFARHHLRSSGDLELDENVSGQEADSATGVSKSDDGAGEDISADDAQTIEAAFQQENGSGEDTPSDIEKTSDADAADVTSATQQKAELKDCTGDNYRTFAVASFMTASSVCGGAEEAKDEACKAAEGILKGSCIPDKETCLAFWDGWCVEHAQTAEKKPEAPAAAKEQCSKAILVEFLLASSTNPCSLQAIGDRADSMVSGIVESRNCPGHEGIVREAIREAHSKGCKAKEMLENTHEAIQESDVPKTLDCSNVDNLMRHFMNMEPSVLCAKTIEEQCQDPVLAKCDNAACLEKAETVMRTRQCRKCDNVKAEEHLRALSDLCEKEASVYCSINLSLNKFECEPEACTKLLGKIQREKNCSASCNKSKMRKVYEDMDKTICEQTAEEHCTEDKLSSHVDCDQADCIEVVTEVLAAKECGGLCDLVALSAWWEEKEGVCKKSEEEHCRDAAADMENMRCNHKDCVGSLKSVMEEKLCPSSNDELLAATSGKKEHSPEEAAKQAEAIKAQDKLPPVTSPAECDAEGMREASVNKKNLCEAGMSEYLSDLSLEFNCSEEQTMLVINKLRKSQCVGGRLISENTCDIDGLLKSLKTKNALCEDDAPKLICGRVMSKHHCSMTDCVGAISAERAVSCKQSGVEVHVLSDTTQVNDIDEQIRGKGCNDQGLFEAMAGLGSKCEPEMAGYCNREDANLMGCSPKLCKQLLKNIRSVECPELVKAGEKPSSDNDGGVLNVEEKMVVYDGDKPKAISGEEAAASEKPGAEDKKPAVAPEEAEKEVSKDEQAVSKDEKLTPADTNKEAEEGDGQSLKTLNLACSTMKPNDYNEHAALLCKAHNKNSSEVGEAAYSKTCGVICADSENTGDCVRILENIYANCEDFQ